MNVFDEKIFFCFNSGKTGVISFMILCTSCNSIGSHDEIKVQLQGSRKFDKDIKQQQQTGHFLESSVNPKSKHINFRTNKLRIAMQSHILVEEGINLFSNI